MEKLTLKCKEKLCDTSFDDIIALDPTSKPNKMGKYCKWLLKLYIGDKLKSEDFYKAKEYLQLFKEYFNKIPAEQRDLMKTCHDLPSLYRMIEPYYTAIQNNERISASKGEEIRKMKNSQAERFYEDNEWVVIIPKTEEASCLYGKGTQWCTAATNGKNMFNYYSKQEPLYININKQTGEKYQFHFESGQFMDSTDSDIEEPIAESIGLTEGLLNAYGKVNPKFKERLLGTFMFYEYIKELGLYKVKNAQRLYNYIDENGKPLFNQWFIYIGYDSDCGLFRVVIEPKVWTYITIEGNAPFDDDIIYSDYDRGNDVFLVQNKAGKMNFVNRKNEFLLKEWF